MICSEQLAGEHGDVCHRSIWGNDRPHTHQTAGLNSDHAPAGCCWCIWTFFLPLSFKWQVWGGFLLPSHTLWSQMTLNISGFQFIPCAHIHACVPPTSTYAGMHKHKFAYKHIYFEKANITNKNTPTTAFKSPNSKIRKPRLQLMLCSVSSCTNAQQDTL